MNDGIREHIQKNLSRRACEQYKVFIKSAESGNAPHAVLGSMVVRVSYMHGLYVLELCDSAESSTWEPIASAKSPHVIYGIFCLMLPDTKPSDYVEVPAEMDPLAFARANVELDSLSGAPS